MRIDGLGVWFPTGRLAPDALAGFAGRVEGMGYTALWYPESDAWEAMAQGMYLLDRTARIRVGSAIANIYARDAIASRQGLATLAACSGDRYVLGLGVSHPPLVEGLRGHHYGRPIASMRAYLKGIAGDAARAGTPARPVLIAALRPRMLALAAEACTGALPYNVTPEHTAEARRIMGPDAWLVVEQKVCLSGDATAARRAARREMARYMRLDNYRNNWLEVMDFTEAELADGGSDRFLDAMVAWGDADALKARVAAHRAAGADHVAVQPVSVDGPDTVDWAALEAMAPAR